MPAPISMDLRLRIVRAVEGGSSIREAARRFAVSPVGRDQADAAGARERQRRTCTLRRPPAAGAGIARSRPTPVLEAMPDITLAELRTELQRRCGVQAGLSTIHNALRRIGLRHKKSP